MQTKAMQPDHSLPPGQQLVANDKWPLVGERLPLASNRPWSLEISGQVQAPKVFSLDALQALPQREQTIDLHCVTRWSKLGVRFHGVALQDLLQLTVPTDAAQFVSFVARSEREHSSSLALTDALELDAIVATSADGEPLSVEHGGPIRLVVPRRYFYKSVKWLERIELIVDDRLGYWEGTAGYHNQANPWRQQRYIASEISKSQARAILESRDVRDGDLLGLAVDGVDLRGLRANNAALRDASFRGCDLTHACFDGANLSNAHFENACLQNATFRGADLDGANFEGADLRNAALLADSMVATSFVGAESSTAAIVDRSTVVAEHLLDQLTPFQRDYLLRSIRCSGNRPNADRKD